MADPHQRRVAQVCGAVARGERTRSSLGFHREGSDIEGAEATRRRRSRSARQGRRPSESCRRRKGSEAPGAAFLRRTRDLPLRTRICRRNASWGGDALASNVVILLTTRSECFVKDAELRDRLLNFFYGLRNSNGGFVPVDEMILGGNEPVTRETISGVCRRLGEAGLIEWKRGLLEGHTIGSARITALGTDAVECSKSASIDIRIPNRAALATYSRGTIIAASHMLKALGHSGISEFLLEAGLPDSAGEGGGLQAKVTSLAKFAIENPTECSPAQYPIG